MNPRGVYTSSRLDARAAAGKFSVRIRRVLQKVPNVYRNVEKEKMPVNNAGFFLPWRNGNRCLLRWLIEYKQPSVKTRTRSVYVIIVFKPGLCWFGTIFF